MKNNSKHSVQVSTPGERDVVVKRRFDAPVNLVWRCHTQADLVRRWLLGPPGWSMPVCQIDLREGGQYHYRWRNEADGTEFGIKGIFEQIVPERLIVHSEQPEDAPEMSMSMNRIDFIADGDTTELVMTMTYGSSKLRKQVLASGMTDGIGMSFDKLDMLLNQQRS